MHFNDLHGTYVELDNRLEALEKTAVIFVARASDGKISVTRRVRIRH